jgi:DNA (cytosine-5)-methyltransferase 1
MLGLEDVGIEFDKAACATREAAGHQTICADVSAYPTAQFVGNTTGLIASPPCQDFSVAGKKAGMDGARAQLITEVLRWVEELQPEWVACEQVPPVLKIWESYAEVLEGWGYSTWTGRLNAADFGVPQTRKRAFLLASRVRPVAPPQPTHCSAPVEGLFGGPKPWVTMGQALGWGEIRQMQQPPVPSPYMTMVADGPPWWSVRPSTTIVGSFSPDIVAGPGVDLTVPRQKRRGSVRITESEGLVLQSFRPDYPVQGPKTKRWQQIGNAVPPLLAAHVIAAVAGIPALMEDS